MQSSVDIEFADGTYTFALPLPRLNELQTKCGIGVGGLFSRVAKGCFEVGNKLVMDPAYAEFYALDIIEPIRQGLIGGNSGIVDGAEIKVTPSLADRLIQNYVLDRPLTDSWSLSLAILGACIKGYDPPKKAEPATKRAKQTATAD